MFQAQLRVTTSCPSHQAFSQHGIIPTTLTPVLFRRIAVGVYTADNDELLVFAAVDLPFAVNSEAKHDGIFGCHIRIASCQRYNLPLNLRLQ